MTTAYHDQILLRLHISPLLGVFFDWTPRGHSAQSEVSQKWTLCSHWATPAEYPIPSALYTVDVAVAQAETSNKNLESHGSWQCQFEVSDWYGYIYRMQLKPTSIGLGYLLRPTC